MSPGISAYGCFWFSEYKYKMPKLGTFVDVRPYEEALATEEDVEETKTVNPDMVMGN